MNNLHNHDVEIEQEKLSLIVKNQRVRRELTKTCHHWFFHIYFAHYVKYKTARFQKELFEITEDESQKTVVIEAFRGSGKTTIMGTSYAIWSILGVQQKKFVLMIAKTESQARQYLANVKMDLEANKLLLSDLGPFEESNDEWRATSIVLPKYGARITVASIENSIRGIKHGAHRPDLIICDDLEDLDIINTAESREKMFKWLMGDIFPLGDKNTRRIIIGTKLHNDSIIGKLRKAITEGTTDGMTKRYPFLKEDGSAMWPEKFSTQGDIDALRRSVPSLEAWEREYMLNIIATADQVVRQEWIHYYDELPPPESYRYAASGVDPAIGENQDNDCTAIVSGKIYGRRKNLRLYVIPNPVNERLDSLKALERIKTVSSALGYGIPTNLWVESVQYQKSIIQQLVSDGFPAKEFKPYGSDKRAKLSIISAYIQNGTILFPRKGAEKLIEQIVGFGSEKHDDLADALCILAFGVIRQDSALPSGYVELISERVLEQSYADTAIHTGEKRLGISLAIHPLEYSAIVLRSDSAAEIIFHKITDDIDTVAKIAVETALKYNVPLSDENIFLNKDDRGRILAEKIKGKAYGHFVLRDYEWQQKYGIFMSSPPIKADLYEDHWAFGYSRLVGWMQKGGKLIGINLFDDLLSVSYTEQNGKRKIIDRSELVKDGIDLSVPEALALTLAKEKRNIIRPKDDELNNDTGRFSEIGL